MAFSKPTDVNNVWASSGDIINPGAAKFATGWTTGEIPLRQHFNYLDNKQDQFIAHVNQMGVPVWDNVTNYQADKSYVQGSTTGTIYRCVQTHTNQNPETDLTNTYWTIAFAGAGEFYTKAETDTAYMAKAQNGADIPNIATFRANISIYSKAETYTKSEVDSKTTVASQAQAEAGVSNTVIMTPLRVAQAIGAIPGGLGVDQTWQNLIGSRSVGVSYTNTTGKPISVSVVPTATSLATSSLTVGGVVVASLTFGSATVKSPLTAIVPNGAVYTFNSTTTIDSWAELR